MFLAMYPNCAAVLAARDFEAARRRTIWLGLPISLVVFIASCVQCGYAETALLKVVGLTASAGSLVILVNFFASAIDLRIQRMQERSETREEGDTSPD